jgi:hypothetical protein
MRESKNKALDEGNCDAARRRGKEAGVKTASPRTEMCSEADDTDKLAPHNGVQDSVSQVKHGVVPGRFTPLLGEACPTSVARRARSTDGGNVVGERAGVSRGRSSAGHEPGVGDQAQAPEPNGPDGLTQARRTELKGRTVNRSSLTQAMTPTGRAWQWRLLSGETDTARGASLAHS